MLKFEGIPLGTTIKAYDFEPFPGRRDRYVVGKIANTVVRDGALFYVIACTEDSAFPEDDNRVGLDVFVPMEMCMDFDERVTVVEEA